MNFEFFKSKTKQFFANYSMKITNLHNFIKTKFLTSSFSLSS